MRGQELEDAIAHQAGRHRHDGHPSRLQAKVDIGGTDDGAHSQTGGHASDREAAPGRYRRSHGVGVVGDDASILLEPAMLEHLRIDTCYYSVECSDLCVCTCQVGVIGKTMNVGVAVSVDHQ